jgi:hypothetical protein
VIGLVLGHVGGIPIEETVASLTPAVLLAFGAAAARLRGWVKRGAR